MAEKTEAAATGIEASSKQPGGKSIATREENRYMVPPVDIYETDGALTVIVDIPGVGKNGVDIKVEETVLTIKGKVRYTPAPGIVREEFSLLDFFRQFQLSDEVDIEKISAEVKDGVLRITLPKAEKAKPHQVKIKVG